jgi:hypothetical protein
MSLSLFGKLAQSWRDPAYIRYRLSIAGTRPRPELIQPVGGNLAFPFVKEPRIRAGRPFPDGRGLHVPLPEKEFFRLGDPLPDIFGADDLGGLQEVFPIDPAGDLLGRELAGRRDGGSPERKKDRTRDGCTLHVLTPRTYLVQSARKGKAVEQKQARPCLTLFRRR